MGTLINQGSQKVTFSFKELLLSEFLNKINHNIQAVGIYEGGDVIIIDSFNIKVEPTVILVRDTVADLTVRSETKEEILLQVAPDKPYIVGAFEWRNTSSNYVHFTAKAKVDVDAEDMIFARVVYDDQSAIGLDTTERTVSANVEVIAETNYFKVIPEEPYSQYVYVSPGEAYFNNLPFTFSGALSPAFTPATISIGNRRTDLLGINLDSGLLVIELGTEVLDTDPVSYPLPSASIFPIAYFNFRDGDIVARGDMVEYFGREFNVYNSQPYQRGYMAVSFAGLNGYDAPVVNSGGELEINGEIYRLDTSYDISTLTIADGVYFIIVDISTGSPVYSLYNNLITYNYELKGYYKSTTERAVMYFMQDGTNYLSKIVLDSNKESASFIDTLYYQGDEIRKWTYDRINSVQMVNQWIDYDPGAYIGGRTVLAMVSKGNYTLQIASIPGELYTVFTNGDIHGMPGYPAASFGFSPTGSFGLKISPWTNWGFPVAYGTAGQCKFWNSSSAVVIDVDFGATNILDMDSYLAVGIDKYSVSASSGDFSSSVWTSYVPSVADTYNYIIRKEHATQKQTQQYAIIQSDALNMIRITQSDGAQTPVTTKPTGKIIGKFQRAYGLYQGGDPWVFISSDSKFWNLSSDFLTFTDITTEIEGASNELFPVFTSTSFEYGMIYSSHYNPSGSTISAFEHDVATIHILVGQAGEVIYSVDGESWSRDVKTPASNFIGVEPAFDSSATSLFAYEGSEIRKIPLSLLYFQKQSPPA